MKYKTYDLNGYKIYTIQTDKFKNSYIEINFRDDVREVSTCKRNFLSNMLAYSSKKYPTKREMLIQTEELYNVILDRNVSRVGYNLFTSFSLDILSPKFIKEKNYLENCIQFLLEIIKNPNIKEEEFDELSYQIIKERIETQVDQYKERPTALAMVNGLKELFPNSISGKRLIGTEEEIESITRKDLVTEYHNMLENSYCDILVIGDIDMDKMVSIFQKNFYKPSIITKEIPFIVENKIEKKRKVEKESTFEQTQLLQFYQLEKLTEYEQYYVLPIFQRILGRAGLSDKLSKYLRGENSLCYYVQCDFHYPNTYASILVGLSYENVNKALKYIHKSMKEMENKMISEEFLATQKEKSLSDLKLREDDIYGLIDNYYFHEISHAPLYQDYLENIPSVTLEDIRGLSKKMHESLLYILKEGDEYEEN